MNRFTFPRAVHVHDCERIWISKVRTRRRQVMVREDGRLGTTGALVSHQPLLLGKLGTIGLTLLNPVLHGLLRWDDRNCPLEFSLFGSNFPLKEELLLEVEVTLRPIHAVSRLNSPLSVLVQFLVQAGKGAGWSSLLRPSLLQ